MNRTRHLVRSSALVLSLYVLEKITGLAKLFLMTRQFGTGADADAYTAANQLPELFLYALTGGAVAAAFIPVYSSYLVGRRRGQADALGNTLFTLTVLAVGGIALLAGLAAPWICQVLLVPEFSPELQALTAELMRIVLLSSVIVGVASVFSSLLQAHRHFLAPALALSLIDLGQIFGLYVLAPRWGIHGVAWGSVIGALLLLCTQLPALRFKHISVGLGLSLRLSGVGEMARLIWPRMVTVGVVQAVDLIFLRLASPLPAGSITAYFYAMLVIVAMPKSLFTGAITTVFFPTLADEYNGGRLATMQSTLYAGLRAAWLLTIPSAVGLLALGEPAVSFLFQRGAFDERSTSLVFGLMTVLALRLVTDTTQDVVSMAFYARHNTRIVMWANLGWAALYILLCGLLVDPYGIWGLALASTLSSLALAGLLFRLNRAVTRGWTDERSLAIALGRALLACGGMALFVRSLPAWGLTGLPYLLVGMAGGAAIYAVLSYAAGGRELITVWSQLVSKQESEPVQGS